MEIDGSVAVVAGAAAGIGQAIAGRLARLGARLVLADISSCAQTLSMTGYGPHGRRLNWQR
jgi:NAD(P)-dependent dehydrogenase (short-subunit alcohol dehydrogenase family)